MEDPPTAMPKTEKPTALKEATQSAIVVARYATKRCDAPGTCVVFVTERAIQPKSPPTSSLSVRAKLTRVIATRKSFSAETNQGPLSAVHQASLSTSLVRGL